MPYITPAILLQQFDNRVIGDVAQDNGIRVSPANLLTDPNVLFAISRASGVINAACVYAERYTPAQLAALVGDDAAILQGLCADLTFVFLCQRRGIKPSMYDETFNRSEELLSQLRDGKALFNVPGNVAQGVPSVEFASNVTYVIVNSLRTSARWFYPVRSLQRPATGGYNSNP